MCITNFPSNFDFDKLHFEYDFFHRIDQEPVNFFSVKLITVSGVSGSSLIPQEDSGVSGGGGRSGSKFSFKLSAGLGLQLLLQNNKK